LILRVYLGIEFFDRFDKWRYEISILYGFISFVVGVDDLWKDFFYFLRYHSHIFFAGLFPGEEVSIEREDLLERIGDRKQIGFESCIRIIEISSSSDITSNLEDCRRIICSDTDITIIENSKCVYSISITNSYSDFENTSRQSDVVFPHGCRIICRSDSIMSHCS
jgi:hypothetical protein